MYNKLLSTILKRTNSLIKSTEYKEAYRIGTSFTRNRKLSFSNTIYFICSALRKSISFEIADFIEQYPVLKFPDISKQAFSKARQHISFEAFKELCRLFVDSFYNSDVHIKKWNGFNVFAVDGTSLQVPDTIENIECFGFKENQSNTKSALASASALYDVLNDIVIDATICSFPSDERKLAKEHINSITNKKLLKYTVIIFDRGYPSYDLFNFLEDKDLFFLMRVPSTFKLAQNTNCEDCIVSYKSKKVKKELRVLKIKLPSGITETLVTNILDKRITPAMFKQLYSLRWVVECKYKELKTSIEIEEFSGTKPAAIKQDFYVSIYLSMLASLIKKDTDLEIAKEHSGKNLKSKYQANKNFILSQVFKKIITMMIKPISCKWIIDFIIKKAQKIKSQVRPNRTRDRKNKHPRKKHHYQIKTCI